MSVVWIASGYTELTDCEYHSWGGNSMKFILLSAIFSFLYGKVLKMGKDSIYILVVGISMFSLFSISHFKDKYKDTMLAEESTTIRKAVIYRINYNQFFTSLSYKSVPEKFKGTLPLKTKNDLGNLKINDTILLKHLTDCRSIMDFHNLTPSKEELKIYAEK